MISPEELTSLRETEEESLPGRCRIHRYTAGAKDPIGGDSNETWVPDGDTVACDIVPTTVQERIRAGREGSSGDYIITLPYGTVVDSPDRIVVEEWGDAQGRRPMYEVTEPGIGDPYETAVEVVAKRVT